MSSGAKTSLDYLIENEAHKGNRYITAFVRGVSERVSEGVSNGGSKSEGGSNGVINGASERVSEGVSNGGSKSEGGSNGGSDGVSERVSEGVSNGGSDGGSERVSERVSGLAGRVQQLAREDSSVRRLVNHKKLSKEVSECFGALVRLESSARRLPPPLPHSHTHSHTQSSAQSLGERIESSTTTDTHSHTHSHTQSLDESTWSSTTTDTHCTSATTSAVSECEYEDSLDSLLSFSALRAHSQCATHSLTVIDVCSGKGISSFLLALLLPHARVVMLDSNPRINREHLRNPACSNISFVSMDIHTHAFERFMSECGSEVGEDGRPSLCLVMGTHLCGHLSTRLVSVFSSAACDALPVLVVSPCCMPRKQSKKKSDKAAAAACECSSSARTLTHTVKLNTPHTQNMSSALVGKRPRSEEKASVEEEKARAYSVACSRALKGIYAVDSTALSARLRRNGWDPYEHWCVCVLFLLQPSVMRRNLLRDPLVQSEKDAFITAVRISALART